ncbi:MAG: nitroreductase [Bacteroidota bacterium]
MDPVEVHRLIKKRRSYYPPQFLNREIPRSVIEALLKSANEAPSHKLTEPWRFKVISGPARKRFGEFMSEKYRSITPIAEFSIAKYEKIKTNPQKSGAALAICMQRDLSNKLPEWEELAAVAMSVQNIWIACSGYGIGGYWSSPNLIDYFGEFQKLAEGEKCMGIFYMGYIDKEVPGPIKKPIEDKVVWIDK